MTIRVAALNKSVRRQLRMDLCQISFVKADGTKRKMLGTLHPSFLPPKTYKGPSMQALMRSPFQVVAWDVEVQEFRSFRLDRLKSLKSV